MTDIIDDDDHLGASASTYRILLAKGDLAFLPLDLSDPVPLARQILTAAGLKPRDGYSLFAVLPSGDFEDLRLDEPFDLRGRGAERFIAFQTDRDYKLTLNDAQLEWGKPVISGAVLYGLAEAPPYEAVFLQVDGGEDRLIEANELVSLDGLGVEHFITAKRPPKKVEIIINTVPHTVFGDVVTFTQIVAIAFPGPDAPDTVFSMSYRRAASQPHSGELAAGGSVEIKNGTIFNVTRTVQS